MGEEWLAAQHHLRPRTRQLYRTALDRHINPRLGASRIGDINADRIAAFILELQRTGSRRLDDPRHPRHRSAAILCYAARRGLIPDNPIRRLERGERPRVGRREMRILAPATRSSACSPRSPPAYRPIIATAIFTGLRQGELLGLTWADIDFDAGVIHVRRQLDRDGGYAAPKTPQAYRDVILMPSLATLLREHKLASAHSRPGDPVFATLTGAPMYYRNVSRGLAAAVEQGRPRPDGRAAAPLPRPPPHLRLAPDRRGPEHRLRQPPARHASPSFTLDVYGGLFDRAEHARRATDASKLGSAGCLRRPSRSFPRRFQALARARLFKPFAAVARQPPQVPWCRAKCVESGLSPTDGGVK